MMSIAITAEAIVNPTEDEDKVRRCLQNLFPTGKIERLKMPENRVMLRTVGEGLGFLAALRNLIRQERIRSAARKILFSGTEERRLQFYLNKQAAFVGRISFCAAVGESPLGPIEVRVETATPQAVVDYLAALPGRPGYPEREET